MSVYRILLVPIFAVLLMVGCSGRRPAGEMDELHADNTRLTNELANLHRSNVELERQRNEARNELIRLRETNVGLERQLREGLSREGWGRGIEVIEGGRGLRMGDEFLFARGSANLTENGRAAIAEIATRLRQSDYADTNIVIEGHTDPTPVTRPETVRQFQDNWGLSAMRSAAVVRELPTAGIHPSRLQGVFRAEHSPIPGASNEKNRRVEIFVSLRK